MTASPNFFQRLLQHFVHQEVGDDFAPGFLPTNRKTMRASARTAPVSRLLPYRTYDPMRQLYFNMDSVGFALICAPATGLNEDALRTLELLFTAQYRANTILQVSLVADPNCDALLENWRAGRTGSTGFQEVFSQLARRRVDFLRKGCWQSLFAEETVMIRDYHLVITVNQPLHEGQTALSTGQLDELERHREAVIGALKSANILAEVLRPELLINLYGDLLRPTFEPTVGRLPMPYNDLLPINEQLVSNETSLYIQRDSVLLKWRDNYVSCLPFSVKQFPMEWMGVANGELIGAFFNRIQRIGCPFIITLNVQVPDQMDATTMAKNKMLRATQMKDTEVGRYVTQWKDRFADWTYAVKCVDAGSRLLRVSYQCVLFAPLGREQECEQSLKNVFSAIGWTLVKDRFSTKIRTLSAFPLWIGREAYEVMNKQRMFSSMLSWNVVNVAPWLGEWKGNVPPGKKPMLMFIGRRGQLCYLDPFLNTKGNFNIAVAAASGAGKSFFTQDYVQAILGSGGRVFIIDSGRSYENLCQILDGEYITFDPGSRIVLNPFSTIAEDGEDGVSHFSDQLPLLTELLATMASPVEVMSSKHKAILSKAIMQAWGSFGPKATITWVQRALLKSPEEEGKDLAVMLSPYCEDGAYAEYFEGEANVQFRNNFVVLELDALNAKGDLQIVVLFLLMKRITEAMYLSDRSQRKMCIIDEAWRLMGRGNAGGFIEEGYRTARKYGGAFMTVTQGLPDFYKSETATAAYNNSDFVFLLRQKPESLAEVKNKGYLVMNPFEEKVYGSVTTFGGRYSEIAIKSPDGLAVGQLIVDPFSSKLMSTKAEDVEAIKRYQREGLTKLQAIEKVAQS